MTRRLDFIVAVRHLAVCVALAHDLLLSHYLKKLCAPIPTVFLEIAMKVCDI